MNLLNFSLLNLFLLDQFMVSLVLIFNTNWDWPRSKFSKLLWIDLGMLNGLNEQEHIYRMAEMANAMCPKIQGKGPSNIPYFCLFSVQNRPRVYVQNPVFSWASLSIVASLSMGLFALLGIYYFIYELVDSYSYQHNQVWKEIVHHLKIWVINEIENRHVWSLTYTI